MMQLQQINKVTKKQAYYQNTIQERKNDDKVLWETLNEIIAGAKNRMHFLNKKQRPLQKFLVSGNKADQLRRVLVFSGGMSSSVIANSILKNKQCVFAFQPIGLKKGQETTGEYQ